MEWIIAVIVAVEIWYWFWWLPRNWRTNKECRDLLRSTSRLYGKDGIVWDEMRKGRL